MAECKIEGCIEKEYKNGLCPKHYEELSSKIRATLAVQETVTVNEEPAGEMNTTLAGEEMVKDEVKASVGIKLEAFLLRMAKSAGRIVATYKKFTRLGAHDATQIYLKRAESCEKKGRYDKAVSHIRKVIELRPENSEAYYKLGLDYENIGKAEEAMDAYREAVKFDANYLNAHYRLGILYSRKDSHNEALTHLERARALGPEYAEVYYRLGILHDKKKSYDKAIECFEKALKLQPTQIRVYKSLGFTYDSIGMHDNAIACFKKAIELEEG